MTPQPRQPEPAPTVEQRLRALARRVERLGTTGRFDPETVVIEKLTITRALRRLAREAAA